MSLIVRAKARQRACCLHRKILRSAVFAVAALAPLHVVPSALAVNQYWDTNGATAGFGAGNGMWSDSSASAHRLWGDSAGTAAGIRWSNGNDAFFNGNASPSATITPDTGGSAPSANSVTFNGTGYTVSSNTLTLTGTASITTAQDATIQSILASTVGVTKLGTAQLTLSGNNTFTGALAISNGTISVPTINSTQTAAQPLGQSGTAITLGTASTAGTLLYTGAAAATVNRGFTVAVGGGAIKSTTGALTLGTAGTTSGMTVASGGIASFEGPITVNSTISGLGGVTKTNTSSTLTFNNTQSYSGNTTINGGTFAVNGTISTAASQVDINSGAKLVGTGNVQRTVNINTGGTISPAGDGLNTNVGAIATNNQNWNAGSTYVWEIKDATAAAGTGYDTINVTGTLAVNATNTDNTTKVLIKLVSHGAVTNWNSAEARQWDIASATSISGFSADKFVLDVTDFTDDNSIDANGSFGVDTFNSRIRVTYSVPEPGSATLLAGASLALLARRRRRD
jgi:autotransporter-associated beta strand protein